MIEIIHISDLHFGQSANQTLAAKALLKRIQDKFNIKPNGNRYLLITGDITNSGSNNEFFSVMKALAPFRDSLFMVPGNHDYGGFFGTDYSDDSAQAFDDPFAASLGLRHPFYAKEEVYLKIVTDKNNNDTKVMLIGLNSCKKKGASDFAQGKIEENQLRHLEKIMTDSDKQIPTIVFLHHIPHKEANWPVVMELSDREALMKTLADQYDVLAFGHQGGKLEDPDNPKSEIFQAGKRMMKIITKSEPRPKYILDADNAVDDQACYQIKIEKRTVSVDLIPFGKLVFTPSNNSTQGYGGKW